jgi:hypothetical protein
MIPLFLRITLVVAVALVALIVLAFVLKVLFFAALTAALVVGVMLLVGFARRMRLRGRGNVVTYRR